MRSPSLVLGAAVSVFCALAQSAAHAAVVITPVGAPNWDVADTHTFAAPLGTAASGYVEFGQTLALLLPPPNHQPHPALGIGPGVPHTGFTTELASGVAANGFTDKAVFATSEFTAGKAVYFVFMAVANDRATGSTPDYANGPMIPNSMCPIHVTFETRKDGVVFDASGAFDVPSLAATDPPFSVAGHSHFPNFFADNFDFAFDPAGPITGNYEYRITMRDVQANGYDITASFAVVPEPTAALAGLALCAFGLLGRKRR